jgi:hypothetical protein
LARKVTLALTSDFFDMILHLLQETNVTFWKKLIFQEKLLLALGDKKLPN